MVLRPILDSELPTTAEFVSAWHAVEQHQTANASAWWLITQPDHAALSGEIAAHFAREGFPKLDAQIIHAIAMHDAGWNLFESDRRQPPRVHPDGRPVSFFEIDPPTFLRAWTASVDRAQEDSAAGAYLVSQHFAWLGEFRLQRGGDPPDVQQQVRAFLADESRRRAELARSPSDISRWDALLPVLQFCDLCSLFLCSGSRQPVEFPQAFAAGHIRARYDDAACVLTPSPFAAPWKAVVNARRHPRSAEFSGTGVSVLVR